MDGQNRLGSFLKGRRQRLDPKAFGLSGRRRTPGLRREEVAARANISITWYTWLEQGRGGPPSAQVVESLAAALMLTDAEREHLYLVGIGQLPKGRSTAPDAISPRLQRFLDALVHIPAIIATSCWDIVAWNFAARAALTDYPSVPETERNVLKRMFLDPETRGVQVEWEAVARYLVATFRAETARVKGDGRAADLIAELSATSAEFAAMWADNDVQSVGDGIKQMRYPAVGTIAFEFSSFSVDGRADLKLVTYRPAGLAEEKKLDRLCGALQAKDR